MVNVRFPTLRGSYAAARCSLSSPRITPFGASFVGQRPLHRFCIVHGAHPDISISSVVRIAKPRTVAVQNAPIDQFPSGIAQSVRPIHLIGKPMIRGSSSS